MRKLVLAITLVLGFVLNTAVQELNSFVRHDQFKVCLKGMGLVEEDLQGEYGYFMAAVVWDCVDETSYSVKTLNFLTYRPHLLEKKLMEKFNAEPESNK